MQFQYPHSRTIHYFRNTQARLAQSVEHQTFNLRVAGSSPSSGGENFQKRKIVKSGRFERFDDFWRLAPLCGVQKRFWRNFWRKRAKTKVIFLHHFLKHQYHGK